MMGTGWLHDLRHGLRRLSSSPGFSIAAALTLALGIGANSAIFSVVNGVLMRPLPFPEPERLVFITREGDVSILDGEDWRTESRTLEEIGLFLRAWNLDLLGAGEPVRLNAAVVEPEFFRVLRLPPLLGRVLAPADNRPGAASVAVVSEGLWRGRLASDPEVLGRTITLSDIPTTIVGVARAELDFLGDEVDLWIAPAVATPWTLAERGTNNFDAIGRLAEGATLAQARTEMLAISKRLEAAYPDTNRRKIVEPLGLLDFMVGHARRALLVLLAAVGLVVLVASVNLATALLARSAARREEFAVRLALGASRGRVARQLVVEGLLLALLAGSLGLVAAAWTRDALVSLAANSLPRLWAVSLDLRVVGFTLGVSLLAGIAMSVLPAWQVARQDPAVHLRGAGRGLGLAPHGRLMGALVAAEVGLALVLLVGSGLLLQTFLRLSNVALGFDPTRVLSAEISLPESRYLGQRDAQTQVFRGLVERLNARPEVVAAAYVITPPLAPRGGLGGAIEFREPPDVMPEDRPGARARLVLGDYFGTLRIPIVEGRPFTAADAAGAEPVAIINELFAREFWPERSPIGSHVAWRGWSEGPPVFMTIVGVASDIKGATLDRQDFRTLYCPYAQRQADWQRWGSIVVRTRTEPGAFARTVQQVLWDIDPAVPLGRVATLEQTISEMLGPQRFNAVALGLFALIALVVALHGLHAVLARSVEERRSELGLRMALGAHARDVIRLVVGRGLRLTLVGLGLGTLAAVMLGRLLAELLYEIEPSDPATLAGGALLLGLAALASCYLPARRASHVDPMTALRCE